MQPDSRYVKRTVHKFALPARRLGKHRNIRVFLPPDYDEHYRYPVIYCQDGEQFFNFGRIVTHALRRMTDEGDRPMIIAGIDVDMPHRTAEYSPDGDRFTDYCAFITEELVPFIESRYSVKADPKGRLLAGCSLGATVSLHLALGHPELSQRVLALSGAFGEATLNRLDACGDLSDLKICMIVGQQETAVKTDRGTWDFVRLNREAGRMLMDKGASVVYREYEGTHTWGFWQRHIPEGLALFFGSPEENRPR